MENILFVITKLELGGAQKHLLSLIKRLNKEKFRIFLFTARNGLLVEEAAKIPGIVFRKSRFLERSINPINDLCSLFEIRQFIIDNQISIVHTHSSKAGVLGRLAAKSAGVKFILHTIHGWSFNDYQSLLMRKIVIWLESYLAKFTDKLIAVSKYDKRKGLDNHIGDEKKYELIRYGIKQEDFSAANVDLKKEFGIKDTDLAVVTVTCLKPQKSPQDFLKLAYIVGKAIPNVKFILVGDGILRCETEKLIRKLKLDKSVILAGWRQDVPELLATADLFVLTSLWEGLPICVLEAIAAGRPVIATNTGGVSEVIVDNESGFLVSVGDMGQMAKKTIVLLKDRILRQRLSGYAKNSLAGDYRLERMVEDIDRLYSNLILQKRAC